MSFLCNKKVQQLARVASMTAPAGAIPLTYKELIAVNGGCGGTFSGYPGKAAGRSSYSSTSRSSSSASSCSRSYSGGSTRTSGAASSSSASCNRSYVSSPVPASSSSCNGSMRTGSTSGTAQAVSLSCNGGYAATSTACNGGVTNAHSNSQPLSPQIPNNPTDYHCDINSYNVAIEQGIQNPGTWDGNSMDTHQIYSTYYADSSTQTPQEGTRGYGFYDNDGDGHYDHMYYYDYTKGGDTYQVWTSNGIEAPVETTWNTNGTAVDHSVYVPLH